MPRLNKALFTTLCYAVLSAQVVFIYSCGLAIYNQTLYGNTSASGFGNSVLIAFANALTLGIGIYNIQLWLKILKKHKSQNK